MADQKLSQLTALTQSNLATDDVFLVTDTSATESKKITVAEMDNRFGKGVTEYSSAQTLDRDNKVVIGDTSSAAFTITLPAAANSAGFYYRIIKKTGLTDFNKLTITDGSFSTFLYGAGESVELACDGTNWYAISYSPSETMTYAPTLTNVQNIDVNTSRVFFHNKYMYGNGQFTLNGAGTDNAELTVSVPFATIDTDKLPGGTNTGNATSSNLGGQCTWFDSGAGWRFVQPKYISTTTWGFYFNTQALFGNSLANGDGINYGGLIIPIAS